MKIISSMRALCLLFLISQNTMAQHFLFTNYTVDNGLSGESAGCIVKDKDEFLWIGTETGLNRFNGYDFTCYKSVGNDTTTLPSNSIMDLLVDHNGQLWVATFQGLCVFDRKKNSFRRIPLLHHGRTIPVFESLVVFEDSKKNIWAGASGYGVVKYDERLRCLVTPDFVFSGTDPAKVNSFINSIREDTDGTLWTSSYSHLMHVDPVNKNVRVVENRLPGPAGKMFQAMILLPDGYDHDYLWIGSWGNGLIHFNKRTDQFTEYKFEFNLPFNLSNIVFDISAAEKNELWLATNKGLVVFDEIKKKYTGFIRDSINEKPVINTQVHAIYKDDKGLKWFGTHSGLCCIDPSKQNFISNPLWKYSGVTNFLPDCDAGKILSSTVGSEAWNSRDLKSRPH